VPDDVARRLRGEPEEVQARLRDFCLAKTVGGLRKARFIGFAKVKAQTVLTFAAYNLT
jgi:hypothetical protein